MKLRAILTLFIVIGLGSFMIGCDTNKQGQGEVLDPGAGAAVTGPFLATTHEPLEKWLTERFKVKYVAMTPDLIFDQVPLADINYETSNLPTNAVPLDFAAEEISRRDLLRKVAQHWNLRMSFILDSNGEPSAVRVEG
ncbi:MAG: hypothetical protein AAF236_11485 [Verrucomicrobiota bacterium]